MKTIKNTPIFLFIIALLFISCSNNDDNTAPTPTASDINNTIDEHSQNGTSVGTVTTNITGNLNFSITTQSVPNALSINSNTGEVFVLDYLKIDYETSPVLTANVMVTNSTETANSQVNITLNNVDDIAAFLTSSKADYNAATSGEWIKVTVDEFVLLANSLNEVTKSGATDGHYNFGVYGNVDPTSTGITMANNNGATIPANSFCFAFRYRVSADNTATTKVKVSTTSATSGYQDLGSTLPTHDTGHNYFVLKGNNTPISTTGYLSIYSKSSFHYEIIDEPTNYYYEFADASQLNTKGKTLKAVIRYQGLSTTQKQWD
ncbi:cadherin repeat domain-containing protein [Gelatiniphilus marinus]|uniref:Cadherin repeat domain-containing protein n=1 Tax=Gelatiniphilus marinus TaxID=1759464 RepID=A0ABW5JSI2_9FLAO